MILLFHALWLFDVAKGGEKNGYFRNQDIKVIFENKQILKHNIIKTYI